MYYLESGGGKGIGWQPERAVNPKLTQARTRKACPQADAASLWGLFRTVAFLRETGNVRERNVCLSVGMISLIIPNLLPVFFQDTLKVVRWGRGTGGGGVGGWGGVRQRWNYQGRETTGSQQTPSRPSRVPALGLVSVRIEEGRGGTMSILGTQVHCRTSD